MIYCLIGYTASGKDTIMNRILNDNKNIVRAVSYTSRPIRKNEIDGVTYHYVDNNFFEKEKNNFIEIRTYEVWDGSIWYYGYHKNAFADSTKDYICIIDGNGYFELLKHFESSNIRAFFINSDKNLREIRLKARGDNPNEIKRRMLQDEADFAYFLKNGNYKTVDNNVSIEKAVGYIQCLIDNNL